MEFRRADVIWANLFILPERDNLMSFTEWYFLDRTCVMVPTNLQNFPKSLALLRPLDWPTWICVILVMVFGSVALYLSKKRYKDVYNT
jgi:ABC-type amino acid transport substrate-binding protein